MKFLVSGCSWTYGNGLPDCLNLQKPSNLSWINLLSNRYNAELTNLSLSGSSNGRIFRTILTELSKNEYDIVFCQWSNISRVDLQYNGEDLPITWNNNWSWPNSPHDALKHFFVNYVNNDQALQQWLCQIISLQSFFQTTNQRYIMVSMNNNTWELNHTIDKYRKLANLVDTTYFLGFDPNRGPGRENEVCMASWANLNLDSTGHPTELGHKIIADKINESIRNFGWVS